MKRLLPINSEFLVGNTEVAIELAQPDVGLLALEITLLLHAMTPAVTLHSPSGQRVELTLGSADARATVHKPALAPLRFEMARNQAEYLQAVLLRAYRDDLAEVNHIHLDGRIGSERMDLTILFQQYKPPMSPEEASKLLAE